MTGKSQSRFSWQNLASAVRRAMRLRGFNRHPENRTSEIPDAIDVAMMRRALDAARTADRTEEVPVGAVIYRGEEIIAEAHNVRESAADPTGHAELIAIREAARRLGRWRLSDCSLAVTLEPCPMCAGAIVNARIARLVFGARDPKAGACVSLYRIPTDPRLNHTVEIIEGVLAAECGELLTRFFQRRRVGV